MTQEINMFNPFKKLFSKKKVETANTMVEDMGTPVGEILSHINPIENMNPAQKTKFNDRAQSFSVYLLAAILILTPLLFGPSLMKAFDLPKQTFLLLASLILAIVWSLKIVASKKLDLNLSIFDYPVILLVLVSGVSAYLTVNRFASLTSDPLLYAGSALLFFAITQTVKKEATLTLLIKSFLISGALLSVLSLVQLIAGLIKPDISPFLSLSFNLTGSSFSQALLLGALLPLAIGLYLKSKSKFNLSLMVVNVIGFAVSLYSLYKLNPAILPFEAGWKIATGSLGQTLWTALFGVGPSNFVDAFTLYRPVFLNSTNLWSLRFTSGGPFYFYLLTTLGIFGLSTMIWLAYRIIKLAKKRFELETVPVMEKALFISLFIILAIFAFLPSPTILTVALFALLGFLVVHFNLSENTFVVRQKTVAFPNNFIVNSLVPLGMIAITVFVGYQLGRIVMADYYFAQSLYAAQANRGADTYNMQIQAITLNPMDDNYRVSYSQTNLALANALASQNSTTAAVLSDQQKTMVTQLVQQSIQEARNAVSLAPQRAANWENLASIYQSLINFAQGADQWTLASLNQAISLDPSNAQLRFALGSLYFSARDYQTAAQAFNLAASLKPDYANAHYNLAQALKLLKLNDQAVQELQLTSQLVCVTASIDCDKVNQEISDLGATITASAQTASGSAGLNAPLSTPSAANKNLQNAKTVPPVKISSPSGEINP